MRTVELTGLVFGTQEEDFTLVEKLKERFDDGQCPM
jgi:hypothetical protein